ncbi:hypothetical protein NE237_014070 [Protea cynaroides]|uniref:Uncharacterized protein n=1 Tax=Protea cynaroides TaxID=273540 RepID=A0A9Q0JZK3_9MAGN|nr:hypothetical protein NE237_014070 [Protea cynaroides]
MPNHLEEKTRERGEGKRGITKQKAWRRTKQSGGDAGKVAKQSGGEDERGEGKKENTKQSGGEDDSAEGKKEKTREKFSPLSVIFFPQETDGWFICALASTAGEGEDADAISPLLCKFALAASTAGEGEDADAISPLLCKFFPPNSTVMSFG